MPHLDYALYEPEDDHWARKIDADDDFRRNLAAEGFDSGTVDALLHGEEITPFGKRKAKLPNLENLTAYDAGAEPVSAFHSQHPDEIADELDAVEEAKRNDVGGKYDGVNDCMKRVIDIKGGSSAKSKRRVNPDIMNRPSSAEAHQRLMAVPGRPRRGAELRQRVSASVDPSTRETFMEMGVSMGDTLDLIATYMHRGMSQTAIREALRGADEHSIMSATPVARDSSEDLPRAA